MCRIKGKVLEEEQRSYNPITVGDTVRIMPDPLHAEAGWIEARCQRSNCLWRWNRKKRAPQAMAANVDLAVCVTSAQSPPFRPRFVDRLIISAEVGGIRPAVLVNKCDLGLDAPTRARLKCYEDLGYAVLRCSALTGQGVEDELADRLDGKVSVLVGQSGVGKSSLLNRLDPNLDLKIGEVSRKYDRGIHTTSHAVMLCLANGQRVVDTPGIRELQLANVRAEELRHYYPDLRALQEGCAYSACRHLDEPDCAVKDALTHGMLHPDRYESYVRVLHELQEMEAEAY